MVIRRNLSHSGALSRTHVYSVALRCTQEQAGACRCTLASSPSSLLTMMAASYSFRASRCGRAT